MANTNWLGPVLETRAALAARLVDGMFRVMRWRRQQRLIAADPVALEPRIEPRARALGFAHVYVADETGETQHWLRSPAYAAEAAKRDPIDICHLAIDQFHAFVEHGDRAARDGFVATAQTLLDMGRRVTLAERLCFVMPHFDQVEGYARHNKPWANAMVQGWIGAVFARAYQLTGDGRFAEAASLAIGPCFVDIARGGVRDHERTGAVFYEKYAFAGQSRHVLNGFMASLLGIWDVARGLGDPGAHEAFAEGVATLSDRVLATYDNGYSSLYDQTDDKRATPRCAFYTWVHARQLAALARITGDPRLLRWANRWREYSQATPHRVRTTIACWSYRARNLPKYVFG
ncbi:MAG: D-glucuronyl C5-epimerase [Myxococcales bacterium]|nr:D-glucuronyl C5-epimerase [Myxococcales bacterium]